MEGNDLSARLFRFSVDVIMMLRSLKGGNELRIISTQLGKSATSCGANYEEAQGAVSKPDFANKIGISLKEMREANYWLRILNELYPSKEEIARLCAESLELKKILGRVFKKVCQS